MVPTMSEDGWSKVLLKAGAPTNPPMRPLSYPINMNPSEVRTLIVSIRARPLSSGMLYVLVATWAAFFSLDLRLVEVWGYTLACSDDSHIYISRV